MQTVTITHETGQAVVYENKSAVAIYPVGDHLKIRMGTEAYELLPADNATVEVVNEHGKRIELVKWSRKGKA